MFSTASALELQLLAEQPQPWLRLCWEAEPEPLQQLVADLLQPSQELEAAQGVGLMLALAAAGQSQLADALLLELDARQPHLGLVPDRWGLWPLATPPSPLAAVVQRWLAWRHGDSREALPGLLPLMQQQLAGLSEAGAAAMPEPWRPMLEPAALGLLSLLLAPKGAGDQLRGDLEPPLVQAMGEDVVERHPQEALLFWSGISRRCPSWDYARLKTADLSLERGLWLRSAAALEGATEEQRRNPWLHDIGARLAMAQGRPADALRGWEAAIAAASGDDELVELLRQRRREAEWELELVGHTAPELTGPSGDGDLDRFATRLEELAQRFGVVLPAGAANGSGDPAGFAAFLDQASGRLALAG